MAMTLPYICHIVFWCGLHLHVVWCLCCNQITYTKLNMWSIFQIKKKKKNVKTLFKYIY